MDLRKIARVIVNVVALILAVLALPQAGAVVPLDTLPWLGGVTAILNQVLSVLRWYAEGK